MFDSATILPDVAVSDIQKGKEFYGGTLGLKQSDEDMGGVTYECGGTRLFVYQSQTAGTGQATCFTFEVKAGTLKKTVEAVKAKGVSFEHYDMPGGQRDGDIHIMGDHQAAWFKDPDGNIICIAGKQA